MKKLIFVLINFCASAKTEAQIIFPHGQDLKLATSENIIYDETEVPFIYRGGKVTDLKWMLVGDSIPAVWFTQACLNGTCLIYPTSGQFQNFLNKPDSVGFIKYHFDFKQTHGTAFLKYLIYQNTIFDTDAKTIAFEITYNGISAAVENILSEGKFEIYPNPSNENVYISSSQNNQIYVYSFDGKLMFSKFSASGITVLPKLPSGIYYLHAGNSNLKQKFIIEKQ